MIYIHTYLHSHNQQNIAMAMGFSIDDHLVFSSTFMASINWESEPKLFVFQSNEFFIRQTCDTGPISTKNQNRRKKAHQQHEYHIYSSQMYAMHRSYLPKKWNENDLLWVFWFFFSLLSQLIVAKLLNAEWMWFFFLHWISSWKVRSLRYKSKFMLNFNFIKKTHRKWFVFFVNLHFKKVRKFSSGIRPNVRSNFIFYIIRLMYCAALERFGKHGITKKKQMRALIQSHFLPKSVIFALFFHQNI